MGRVWKQGDGDVDTDTLLTTLDKDGQTLEEGQTTAESSKWTPAQTGIYYFRVRVTAQDGTLVAYGAPANRPKPSASSTLSPTRSRRGGRQAGEG